MPDLDAIVAATRIAWSELILRDLANLAMPSAVMLDRDDDGMVGNALDDQSSPRHCSCRILDGDPFIYFFHVPYSKRILRITAAAATPTGDPHW
jgi:hypothetical protein